MTVLGYFRMAHNGYSFLDKKDYIITRLPIDKYIILRATRLSKPGLLNSKRVRM